MDQPLPRQLSRGGKGYVTRREGEELKIDWIVRKQETDCEAVRTCADARHVSRRCCSRALALALVAPASLMLLSLTEERAHRETWLQGFNLFYQRNLSLLLTVTSVMPAPASVSILQRELADSIIRSV